jgi:hypothetical protein
MRQAGLSATVTHAENSADYFTEMDFWVKDGEVRGLGVTKMIENNQQTNENQQKMHANV